jgi:DNA-binding transcriptional LysR family regulator
MLRFDLIDLRLFAAVAACGSITKAAESLPIALAAASARIKILEETTRSTLLERKSRGVELTASGEVFLAHALAILRETSKLHQDLQQFSEGTRGTIRLHANSNAINEYLPALLSSFLAQNPGINVEMREFSSPEIVRAIDEGDADIGIIGGNVNTRKLDVHPFRDDHLVVVVPLEHALANVRALRFYQVLEWDFVGLGERTSIQSYLSKTAIMLGQSIQFRIHVGSFDAACRMVAAGVGVSIVPASSALRLRETLPIAAIALEEDWARRDLKLICRSRERSAPQSRNLFDWLAEARDAECNLSAAEPHGSAQANLRSA